MGRPRNVEMHLRKEETLTEKITPIETERQVLFKNSNDENISRTLMVTEFCQDGDLSQHRYNMAKKNLQRLNFSQLSDKEKFPVLQALASNRHIGKRGKEYFMQGEEIDENKASNSFHEFKKLFQSVNPEIEKEDKKLDKYDKNIRACLQFIPDAYVPRLVRGIQEMVKLKQNQFNYSSN